MSTKGSGRNSHPVGPVEGAKRIRPNRLSCFAVNEGHKRLHRGAERTSMALIFPSPPSKPRIDTSLDLDQYFFNEEVPFPIPEKTPHTLLLHGLSLQDLLMGECFEIKSEAGCRRLHRGLASLCPMLATKTSPKPGPIQVRFLLWYELCGW